MSGYLHPAEAVTTELVVKNSRFIAQVAHTPGVAASEAFVLQIRQRHPAASHHCWARIAAAPADGRFWSCSDDGEPKGTAGRPMLTVLEHSGIGEITAVVSRYFGGTKLGTGGLVRAYSQAVNQALAELRCVPAIAHCRIAIRADFSLTGLLEQLVIRFAIRVSHRDWNDRVLLEGEIEAAQLAELKAALAPYGSAIRLSSE